MPVSETVNQKMFSIIMATYNCGRKVENTLESIFSQNKDLFELIVFDGNSTDDTLDYIRKYENDLTLISEKDAGVYDAFNKGIERAAGKYLYFIGAGDGLREGVLQKVNESVLPDAPAIVYGDAYVVQDQLYYGGDYYDSLIEKQNICHQAIFYNRKVFQLTGNYELRYKIFADWALNLKCFGDHRIEKRYIKVIIADFEGGGLSSTTDDPAFDKDFPSLLRKYIGIKSYIVYKFPNVYDKIYFPFVRPYISWIKRRNDSK